MKENNLCDLEKGIEKNILEDNMSRIKNKIIVQSGKGGVGKSTISANIAIGLMLKGKKVGLLDVDIHGPNIPQMLSLSENQINIKENGKILPVLYNDLKVMSMSFLIKEKASPVIWRGPMKYNVIKQFLTDVEWGDLDYLIIDCPPGTGDEPLSICQLIPEPRSTVIVTTPQEVSISNVVKSVNFCKMLNVKIIGVLENMSGFVCPKCGEIYDIFGNGGGKKMANEMDVPYLGSIPIEPALRTACDDGNPYLQNYTGTKTIEKMESVVQSIIQI